MEYYSGQFAVSDGQQPILVVGRDESGGRLSFYDSAGAENLCIRSDIYPMPYHGTYFEKSSIQLGGVNSDGNPAAEMYVSRLANGTLSGIHLILAHSDVEYMRVYPESISFYNDTDKTGDLSYQARLGAWGGLGVSTDGWDYHRSAYIGPHDAKFRMPVVFYDGVSGIADTRSGTFIGNGVSGRLIPLGVNAKMVIVKRVGSNIWYLVGEPSLSGSTVRISNGISVSEDVYLTGTSMRLGAGSLLGMNENDVTYHYYAFG